MRKSPEELAADITIAWMQSITAITKTFKDGVDVLDRDEVSKFYRKIYRAIDVSIERSHRNRRKGCIPFLDNDDRSSYTERNM